MEFTQKTIKQWQKERNIAVAAMDLEKFKAFYLKWMERGIYERPLPENDFVTEISMRKMAIEIKSIPQSVKDDAVKWLHDRGMKEGF